MNCSDAEKIKEILRLVGENERLAGENARIRRRAHEETSSLMLQIEETSEVKERLREQNTRLSHESMKMCTRINALKDQLESYGPEIEKLKNEKLKNEIAQLKMQMNYVRSIESTENERLKKEITEKEQIRITQIAVIQELRGELGEARKYDNKIKDQECEIRECEKERIRVAGGIWTLEQTAVKVLEAQLAQSQLGVMGLARDQETEIASLKEQVDNSRGAGRLYWSDKYIEAMVDLRERDKEIQELKDQLAHIQRYCAVYTRYSAH